VIGIMPPGFNFPNESDVWIPLSVPTTRETFAPFRGWLPSRVIARVAPGVSPDVASSRLFSAWQQRLQQVDSTRRAGFAQIVDEVRAEGATVLLQRNLVGDRTRALGILMGATVLLLLIACANVANLILTEATRRRREVAVRKVLGATNTRVIRQMLAESVMLSVGAALLGVAIAPAVLALLHATLPPDLAGVAPPRLDLRVLGFASVLAIVTGVSVGLWPAIGAARGDASETIRSGGHGATSSGLGRARRALVTAELALTVTLLVGAGLMLRSFDRLMSQDFGLNPDRVATAELSFPRFTSKRAERLRVIRTTTALLTNEPGVEAVGAVNDLPLRGGGGIGLSINIDGAPKPRSVSEMTFARRLIADAGYFRAMRIRLLRGRLFTAADDSLAPSVAIISASMARRYWPNVDPVGRTFHFAGDTAAVTVIGVVADVRESRLDRDPDPQMYFSMDAMPPENVAVVARSNLPPASLLTRVREAIRNADRTQAVYNVRMMEDVVGQSVAPRRTNTVLISICAAFALGLAALGVYAVVAYSVTQRSRELGIRRALGASAADLLGSAAREIVFVAAIGITIGLGGAWALSRVLSALLYGIDAHDPATFAIVPLVLLVPAIVATLVPASRAMRVNPADVMRAE
jgi:putative ABC transport system permease protein